MNISTLCACSSDGFQTMPSISDFVLPTFASCTDLFSDRKFKEVFFKVTGYATKRGIVKEKHKKMFLFKILFVILQANYQKKQEKAYGKDSNDNSLGGDGR